MRAMSNLKGASVISRVAPFLLRQQSRHYPRPARKRKLRMHGSKALQRPNLLDQDPNSPTKCALLSRHIGRKRSRRASLHYGLVFTKN